MNAVHWINGQWPGRLAILARPRGGEWLQDEVVSWAHSRLQVIVSLLTVDEANELELTDEARLCQSTAKRPRSSVADSSKSV